MNLRFFPFTRAVAELNTQPGDRARVVATGVALAIAQHLPLPSAPLDAPGSYFTFTNSQSAKELVSMFNEEAVFPVKAALEYVREFWMLRYSAAHPAKNPIVNLNLGFYDNLFGCAKWVNQDAHAFNNLYKLEIYVVLNAVAPLLCQG